MAGNASVKIFSMLWTTLWKDMFYKDNITLVFALVCKVIWVCLVNSYDTPKGRWWNEVVYTVINKYISRGMERSMTKYCQRVEIQITESLLPKSQIAKMVKVWLSQLKNLHRRCPGWGGVVGTMPCDEGISSWRCWFWRREGPRGHSLNEMNKIFFLMNSRGGPK